LRREEAEAAELCDESDESDDKNEKKWQPLNLITNCYSDGLFLNVPQNAVAAWRAGEADEGPDEEAAAPVPLPQVHPLKFLLPMKISLVPNFGNSRLHRKWLTAYKIQSLRVTLLTRMSLSGFKILQWHSHS
ncbi:hypothetical protein AX16_000757, partial [Volvariella volvacea WC 439]